MALNARIPSLKDKLRDKDIENQRIAKEAEKVVPEEVVEGVDEGDVEEEGVKVNRKKSIKK